MEYLQICLYLFWVIFFIACRRAPNPILPLEKPFLQFIAAGVSAVVITAVVGLDFNYPKHFSPLEIRVGGNPVYVFQYGFIAVPFFVRFLSKESLYSLGLGLGRRGPNRLTFLFSFALVACFSSQWANYKIQGVAVDFIRLFVFTAFAEELFFRGFLQTRFERQLGPTLGLILTSAFFGLRHIFAHPTSDAAILHFIPTSMTGMVFGFVYRKSGSIWPLTFLHTVWDMAFDLP